MGLIAQVLNMSFINEYVFHFTEEKKQMLFSTTYVLSMSLYVYHAVKLNILMRKSLHLIIFLCGKH